MSKQGIHYNYKPKERTVDQIIDDKIRVLRDFCVVTDENEKDIRYELRTGINKDSGSKPDTVADRIAKRLMAEMLYKTEMDIYGSVYG